MARIRTIKPEFWSDEKLGPLDPITRLVFLGLVSLADDAGRLVDSVRQLDGLLFPYTEDSCAESLEILARLSRVRRYTSESGQRIIEIVGWAQHQKVDKPAKHVLPPPPAKSHTTEGVAEPSRDPRDNLARSSRDPRAPTLDLGPTTNDHTHTTAGGDELTKWLGENVAAVQRWESVVEMPPGWRTGLFGIFGPRGTDELAWKIDGRRVEEADRPRILALTCDRLATESAPYRGSHFRATLRKVAQEQAEGGPKGTEAIPGFNPVNDDEFERMYGRQG